MKSIFTFYFLIEENYKAVISYFVINEEKDNESIQKFINDLESDFYKLTNKSEEKYGVHDVSFSPDDELFGFTSYEVEEGKINELMLAYKNCFIKKGFEVSNIYFLEESYREDEEDYDEKIELLEERYNKVIEELK